MVDSTSNQNAMDFNDLVLRTRTIAPQAATATLATNAATVTRHAVQVTTESLTTAGGASQALTITLAGITATDVAFVQYAGGTNTTRNITLAAVITANTITVTVYNNTAATALNGTIIFNLWVLKA